MHIICKDDLVCKDDLEGFKTFIRIRLLPIPVNYKDSREFIKIGLNSLQRHNNLNLSFEVELVNA